MIIDPMSTEPFDPLNQKWKFDFILVPPNKLTDTYGSLKKVDISSVTVTESYYSDTRTQAKLTYYGTFYPRLAWVKIVATETISGYAKTLGVFIPTKDNVTTENGVEKTTLELESILYGLSLQIFDKPYVCTKGTRVQDALNDIFYNKGMIKPYSMYSHLMDDYDEFGEFEITNGNSVWFKDNYTIDAGTSILSGLYSIANSYGFRIGVTNTGIPYYTPYVEPIKQNSSFVIKVNASDSVVLSEMSMSSNYLQRVSQVTVHATNDSGDEITSTKQSVGDLSPTNRGYVVGKYYDLNSMSPFTQARADALASSYLTRGEKENVEWTLTTGFMPIHAGQKGKVRGLDDARALLFGVFVKSKELKLQTMTQDLVLKLASSNDTDTGE